MLGHQSVRILLDLPPHAVEAAQHQDIPRANGGPLQGSASGHVAGETSANLFEGV